ncbi:MAG TPA: hypothetical protein VFZ73_05310 [Gemmatimonadaceae bacterium]
MAADGGLEAQPHQARVMSLVEHDPETMRIEEFIRKQRRGVYSEVLHRAIRQSAHVSMLSKVDDRRALERISAIPGLQPCLLRFNLERDQVTRASEEAGLVHRAGLLLNPFGDSERFPNLIPEAMGGRTQLTREVASANARCADPFQPHRIDTDCELPDQHLVIRDR